MAAGVGGKAGASGSSRALKKSQRSTKKFYGSKRASVGPAGTAGKLTPPKRMAGKKK